MAIASDSALRVHDYVTFDKGSGKVIGIVPADPDNPRASEAYIIEPHLCGSSPGETLTLDRDKLTVLPDFTEDYKKKPSYFDAFISPSFLSSWKQIDTRNLRQFVVFNLASKGYNDEQLDLIIKEFSSEIKVKRKELEKAKKSGDINTALEMLLDVVRARVIGKFLDKFPAEAKDRRPVIEDNFFVPVIKIERDLPKARQDRHRNILINGHPSLFPIKGAVSQSGKHGTVEFYTDRTGNRFAIKKIGINTGPTEDRELLKSKATAEISALLKLNPQRVPEQPTPELCAPELYGAFLLDGQVCIRMECISGETLDKLPLKNMPFKERHAIMKQLVAESRLMYEQGVMHCDISQSNLMYDPVEKKLRFIDFEGSGLASEKGLVRYDNARGTPMFLSPEAGVICYDIMMGRRGGTVQLNRSDVYSIGVMLFCLLTRIPPKKLFHDTCPDGASLGMKEKLSIYRRIAPACNGILDEYEKQYPDRAELCNKIKECLKTEPSQRIDIVALDEWFNPKPQKRDPSPFL